MADTLNEQHGGTGHSNTCKCQSCGKDLAASSAITVNQIIYCRACFRLEMQPRIAAKDGAQASWRCNTCQASTCADCKDEIESEDAHECQGPENVYQNAEKGKTCQLCPVCEVLGDGCNHISCSACGADYCYLCGEEATREEGHWDAERGLCTFRHQPGDPRAMRDAVESEEENGEDGGRFEDEASEEDGESEPEDVAVGSVDGTGDGFEDLQT